MLFEVSLEQGIFKAGLKKQFGFFFVFLPHLLFCLSLGPDVLFPLILHLFEIQKFCVQKRQLVFKFLLFSILFKIPLKFTNVKFLLGFYNLMSLDKNKNPVSCLQVIAELQTLFGASTTSLSPCVFTVLCPWMMWRQRIWLERLDRERSLSSL